MEAIDDEGGLMNLLEIGEARVTRLLPLPKCGYLRCGDVRSGRRVEVFFSLCKPLDEGCAS